MYMYVYIYIYIYSYRYIIEKIYIMFSQDVSNFFEFFFNCKVTYFCNCRYKKLKTDLYGVIKTHFILKSCVIGCP